MIEIEGLTKCFGDLTAVDNISLTVPKGEFFVILGPNAAGKTTTIKVMSGLMKATSGRVRICGIDTEANPLEARKRMAYVPDFPFLYDKLTPTEFFRFTGQLFGMEEAAIQCEAEVLAAAAIAEAATFVRATAAPWGARPSANTNTDIPVCLEFAL